MAGLAFGLHARVRVRIRARVTVRSLNAGSNSTLDSKWQ